jgi:hypothetical protein
VIVNHYSVLMLFVSALGLVVAAVLGGAAVWAAGRIRHARGEQDFSAAERSVYLAALTAVVCLAVLLVSWPLFYAMLGSFVPEIPGAMCIYGVTRVMPAMAAGIQAAHPAMIFLLGAWLLLEYARRQSCRPPRRSAGMLALASVAALVAGTWGAELYYIVNMRSLNGVSCCSRYGDSGDVKLQTPSYYLPWELPAAERRAVLNALFFAGLPLLALWLLIPASGDPRRRRALRLAANAALLAASLGLGLAALLEFSEVLSPLLMRLPFHHCLYCLVGNGRVPDAPLILGNLGVGIFAAGWTAILGGAIQLGSPPPAVLQLRRRVSLLAATALLASVLMVAIHLAVPR